MFFIEDECILTDNQKALIDSVCDVEGPQFPFYYHRVTETEYAFLHCLMRRSNDKKYQGPGPINSGYYQEFYNIFENFCNNHNIKIKTVLRGAVNYSIYRPGLTCESHIDHEFPHYNFLLYLTDCNGGDTILYDTDGQEIKRISPKKYKAVVFSGIPHAIDEITPGELRLVLVFTFIPE